MKMKPSINVGKNTKSAESSFQSASASPKKKVNWGDNQFREQDEKNDSDFGNSGSSEELDVSPP